MIEDLDIQEKNKINKINNNNNLNNVCHLPNYYLDNDRYCDGCFYFNVCNCKIKKINIRNILNKKNNM